jgi:1-deoxy-D-xylulose-5-phosphate synthase
VNPGPPPTPLLDKVRIPADLRQLAESDLPQLAPNCAPK